MDLGYAGSTAVVTGGSKGMGLAIAKPWRPKAPRAPCWPETGRRSTPPWNRFVRQAPLMLWVSASTWPTPRPSPPPSPPSPTAGDD